VNDVNELVITDW